eukprot:9575603-Lingulodinium_polyedra.AAC.1
MHQGVRRCSPNAPLVFRGGQFIAARTSLSCGGGRNAAGDRGNNGGRGHKSLKQPLRRTGAPCPLAICTCGW